MDTEINDPELLNKCVRCHKPSKELIIYTLRKPLGLHGARFYRINYSICKNCKPYFEKALEREDRYVTKKLSRIKAVILLFVYIVALIIIFNSNLSFEGFFLVIGTLIATILGIFFLTLFVERLYYKKHPNNIKNYFEVKNDGIAIIRDLESNREIKRINLLSVEREIEEELPKKTYKYCPNCGSEIKTYIGFCQKCGKNLKI